MSVQEIKEQLVRLPRKEQDEVIAYLFHIRSQSKPEYEEQLSHRLADQDRSHWLTPDEFEQALDKPRNR